MTRIFFEHGSHGHTDFYTRFFWTRIKRITRIFLNTDLLHEILWTRITRIKRIFLYKNLRQQNYSCYSDYSCSKIISGLYMLGVVLWTRITRIKRFFRMSSLLWTQKIFVLFGRFVFKKYLWFIGWTRDYCFWTRITRITRMFHAWAGKDWRTRDLFVVPIYKWLMRT